MQFLTVEDYMRAPMGGDTNPPGGTAELYHTIQTAQDLMDEFVNGWLVYKTFTDEIHRIRFDQSANALYFRLRSKPVRQVTAISLVVGYLGGPRMPFGFTSTPDETGVPQPVVQGNVILNRNSSSLQITGPQVLYAPPGIGAWWNAPAAITYTNGYDDGTVQSDGLTFAAPSWVKRAMTITVRHLLQDAKRHRARRSFNASYNLGDWSEAYKDTADASLPMSVQQMLTRQMQHWTIGSR